MIDIEATDADSRPLVERFDVALLDLDGVVFLGEQAVDGVPDALADCRRLGMRLTFVTNNATRTPMQVAERLRSLGIPAEADEVVTSSQAAAHYLAERLPAGSAVLVVGADGLTRAIAERNLVPVDSADAMPLAVVQGYGPQVNVAMLSEAALAIAQGAMWVATNLDATLPSARGKLPGNGSFVAALAHATGHTPISTGKPEPTMHRESVERSGARNPIVVGDRLDTDIAGATAAGCPSLLVLSGVTDARDLLDATAAQRPTYIGATAAALLVPHSQVAFVAAMARCAEWEVAIRGDGICLIRHATEDAVATDPAISPNSVLDALRAMCAAAWRWRDDASEGAVLAIDHDGQPAEQVLRHLKLLETCAG